MLISDQINLKTKKMTRNKGHFVMIKGWIQENIKNIYLCPYIHEAKMDTTKRRNKPFNNYTIIVEDFNLSFSLIDRKPDKISKEIKTFNTINHPGITDIYLTLYPTAAEYIYFSQAHVEHFCG